MCLVDLDESIYGKLDCAGFGWKSFKVGTGGGLYTTLACASIHKTKWNHAKDNGQNHSYKPGFHIPLSLHRSLLNTADNWKDRVIGYVEYKEGHTLGEDYGPCIVASRMRVIQLFKVKDGKLTPYIPSNSSGLYSVKGKKYV